MISCDNKKDTSRACQDGQCQFPFISNYRYCKDEGQKKEAKTNVYLTKKIGGLFVLLV